MLFSCLQNIASSETESVLLAHNSTWKSKSNKEQGDTVLKTHHKKEVKKDKSDDKHYKGKDTICLSVLITVRAVLLFFFFHLWLI